jgi:hypothetical protein
VSDADEAKKELEAALEGTEIIDAPMGTKIAAPLIALGATWAVREVMERVYTKVTGNKPPHASDPDQRMTGILIWAATTAAAVAVVGVAIDRLSAPKRVEIEG